VPIALLALAAAACTGGDEPAPSDSASAPTGATGAGPVSIDPGNVVFEPGEYAYAFNNIEATLSMDGSQATLDVKNHSGGELGKPGMYVIAGDGKRYEATVEASSTIADGDEASFQLTFPDQVTPDTVGLAVLLFGGSNVGAMAPVPV
jgi:hypothetical protein